MEYVGWKDLNSAMRYMDSPVPFLPVTPTEVEPAPVQTLSTHELELRYSLQRDHKNSRDPVKVLPKNRPLLPQTTQSRVLR